MPNLGPGPTAHSFPVFIILHRNSSVTLVLATKGLIFHHVRGLEVKEGTVSPTYAADEGRGIGESLVNKNVLVVVVGSWVSREQVP